MPRARLSKNGPELAKAGYDVDTASLINMTFSPSMVAARIFMQGNVLVSAYTGDNLSHYYRRARVNYGTTFSDPPIVFVSGHVDASTRDITASVTRAFPPGMSGNALIFPHYQIRAETNGFWLYVAKFTLADVGIETPNTWSYVVLANTLSPS